MSTAPRVTLVVASAALAMSAASLASVMIDVWTDAGLIRGKGKVSAPSLPSQPDPATRVLFPREARAGSVHTNQMISLTHNWTWSESGGWSRLDFEEPSVALTVESWFNGLAELNFDVRPPRSYTAWPGGRPFGLFAKHDGTYASLFVGGAPYSKNAAGIQLTGGVTADPIVSISEAKEGREATIIRVERPDGAARLLVAGGDAPGIAFGLSGHAANASQAGVLRFAGNPTNGALIDAAQISEDARILAATPSEATTPRFAIHADGRMTWGGGAAQADAILRRTANGKLEFEAELGARALVIGEGSVLRSVRLIEATFDPEPVRGSDVSEQRFAVPGLGPGSIVIVNGPPQPAGIGLSSARVVEDGVVAIAFFNLASETRRPARGPYQVMAIEGSS